MRKQIIEYLSKDADFYKLHGDSVLMGEFVDSLLFDIDFYILDKEYIDVMFITLDNGIILDVDSIYEFYKGFTE